jgi:hypothetical protein
VVVVKGEVCGGSGGMFVRLVGERRVLWGVWGVCSVCGWGVSLGLGGGTGDVGFLLCWLCGVCVLLMMAMRLGLLS